MRNALRWIPVDRAEADSVSSCTGRDCNQTRWKRVGKLGEKKRKEKKGKGKRKNKKKRKEGKGKENGDEGGRFLL